MVQHVGTRNYLETFENQPLFLPKKPTKTICKLKKKSSTTWTIVCIFIKNKPCCPLRFGMKTTPRNITFMCF